MSVVLGYADEKLTIMACDGRAVDFFENIVNEGQKKIAKISDRVIIGFAGELQASLAVKDRIQAARFIENRYADEVALIALSYLRETQQNIETRFLVSGISKDGKMGLHCVTNQGIKPLIPSGNIVYSGLYPKLPSREDMLEHYLKKYYPNVKKALEETIKYCAKHSNTVNQKMYFEQLFC